MTNGVCFLLKVWDKQNGEKLLLRRLLIYLLFVSRKELPYKEMLQVMAYRFH